MAAVVLQADNVRIDAMDVATNVTSIGGGAAAAAEPDLFYQGAGSISRKVGTALRGFYTSGGGTFNVTTARRTTIMFKALIGNWNALDPQTTPGFRLLIGSGTGTAPSDLYEFDTSVPDIYPPRGGFIIRPIDPNVVGYRDGILGTPSLTAAALFGLEADFSATSKAENVVLDAVDHGAGLNLTRGDGVDADGTFQDFVDHDEGTSGNRYGYVTTAEGILFVYGKLWIGQTNAQVSTITSFTDDGKVVVFPDGLFDVGFSALGLDLATSGTVVTITGCIFNGRGNATTVETRPELDVTGTAGSADFNGCSFDSFAAFNLTSVVTLLNCPISNSLALTQSGATLDGCTISGATTADGVAFILATNPSEIKNCDFTFSDGHAVRCDTIGTYNWDNNTDSGYGGTRGSNLVSSSGSTDAMFYNNSGGLITLNVINGGQAPSVRNGASATTVVNNSVTIEVSGVTWGSAVKVIADETVGTITKGDVLQDAFADTTGKISFLLDYEGAFDPSGLDVIVVARNQGIATSAIAEDSPAVYTDETTEASSNTTNDMNLLPAVPVVNDAYYFGHQEQFSQLKLDVSTAIVGTGNTFVWEYFNGTIWVALSGVSDGTSGLSIIDEQLVSWTMPGDWATTTINSQGPLFYVRIRLSATTTITTVPVGRRVTLDVTRYLPYDRDRIILPVGLNDVATWTPDSISKFIQ